MVTKFLITNPLVKFLGKKSDCFSILNLSIQTPKNIPNISKNEGEDVIQSLPL